MTQTVIGRGRLPGVRCDPALPPAAVDTLRLDVAAFVGFAERGPVNDPQPVGDPAQYAAVFGGDLPLAMDERGVPVYAALPSAVQSYFDNGGRRAYVVRVVGRADSRGPGAATFDVRERVVSRRPLGGGDAVIGLGISGTAGDLSSPATALCLQACSPGGWGNRVAVDIDIVDTVLSLQTDPEGTIGLSTASRRALDEGDCVLVRRGESWRLLWTPADDRPVAPPDGWHAGDVARLLRADLTVRQAAGGSTGAVAAGVGDTVQAVEQLTGLRLGKAEAGARVRSRSWFDALQPSRGGFERDRSMYLRAKQDGWLIPVLGGASNEVASEPALSAPAAFSRAALASEGLVEYDPVSLFLDPELTGHTVAGLRGALEVLGLEDEPRAIGVHAVALVPEIAIVAIPDLYQRPWTEQALVEPVEPKTVTTEPVEPVGFHLCPPPDTGPAQGTWVPPAEAQLRMVVDPPAEYRPAALITVAGEVADLCAARADLIAVLGLPRHCGSADAEQLSDQLAGRPASGTDALSYVGLWHPWGALAESRSPAISPLRAVPPDGAVCGTISATELSRGLWIEPAGRALAGYLSVDQLEGASILELFDRGANPLRRRPHGFVAVSAHSLSADRALLQLTVRRLLIWLRKLALREGNRFVFEPDNERFRAQVTTVFTRFLEQLRLAGALVAFEVTIADLAGRPNSEEGQVRIDLKVAPSSPIEFITVSLIRSGQDQLRVGGA